MSLSIVPRTLKIFFAVSALALFVWSCDYPSGQPKGNTIPETRLANLPANDTIAQYIRLGVIPEQSLYWVGDDPDGFVTAFKYRWIDYQVGRADTVPWTTILNLTNISGTALDTFIIVHKNVSSIFRVYNFLATMNPDDRAAIKRIQDSLASGRMFAVPYPSGPILGDSIQGANPINIEGPTKGTFIFFSQSDSNQHRFEVKAVDNNDAEDQTPAFVHFWTLRSPSPIVGFAASGQPENNQYVLRCPTARSPGLTFLFTAIDLSTDQRDFSYSVDDTLSWSPWSVQPTGLVTAAHFRETGSDTHTIFVRARNRWGAISNIASRRFTARIPPIDTDNYPRRILLYNNTRMINVPSFGAVGGIDTAAIRGFYSDVFNGVGVGNAVTYWNVFRGGTSYLHPPLDTLMKFTEVVLVMENGNHPPFGNGALHRFGSTQQTTLRRYMNAGGKVIYSGTQNIGTAISSWEVFGSQVFYTGGLPGRQDTSLGFIGARGALGYPDIRLDSLKVPADSMFALRHLQVNFPRSFGEGILLYDHKTNNPLFENFPMGIRYLAPDAPPPPCRKTFSTVYFGIPLYFTRVADATAAMLKALQDVN